MEAERDDLNNLIAPWGSWGKPLRYASVVANHLSGVEVSVG